LARIPRKRSSYGGKTYQPPTFPISIASLSLSALNLIDLVEFDVNTLAIDP